MQERSGSARVSCTDRVRDIGLARVLSTGRIREACRTYLPHTGRAEQHGPCSYFGQHESRLVCTGRVRDFFTARGAFFFLVQHGACRLARVKPVLHESTLDLHGSCNFSSSEVGNLNFSQYSGFIMI